MPPDGRREALTREWLNIAKEDLRSAERLAQPDPLLRSAVYHCQQSFEKSLKAYLTWHEVDFPWTHNLEQLLTWCRRIDPDFDRFESAASFISPFATVPRYPADELALSDDDVAYSLEATESVLDFVRDRLPLSVQP